MNEIDQQFSMNDYNFREEDYFTLNPEDALIKIEHSITASRGDVAASHRMMNGALYDTRGNVIKMLSLFEFFFLFSMNLVQQPKNSILKLNFQFLSNSSEFAFSGWLLRFVPKVSFFGYFPKFYAQVYFLGGFMASNITLLLVFMTLICLI